MSPEAAKAWRRLATMIVGVAAFVLAYVLHMFAGWEWRALLLLDALLAYAMIRLLLAEGRERARSGR